MQCFEGVNKYWLGSIPNIVGEMEELHCNWDAAEMQNGTWDNFEK